MPSLFLTPAAKGKRIVVWMLACFAASQLALSIYLDKRSVEIRDPLYGFRLQALRAALSESPDAPLFLVLGSSRIKYGVHPGAMDVRCRDGAPPIVYNFGVNGMGTIRELMYLRRLLADGVRPRWLLAEVWPPLWAEAGFFRESRMVLGEDDLHWGDAALVCRYFLKEPTVIRQGLRKWLLPISNYRSRILQSAMNTLLPIAQVREMTRHVPNWLPKDDGGWFPIPWITTTPEERRRAIEHGADEVKPLVNPLIVDPRSDSALRELLNECRRRDIKVALILMPEHSHARSWYPPQARALVHSYLGQLRREYTLPIVDARLWSPDEDFFDYCHIAEKGVPALSQRLGRDVVQPMIADKPLDAAILLTDEEEKTP